MLQEGKPVQTLTTNDKGEIDLILLINQKYALKETTPPSGYVSDGKTYQITVKKEGVFVDDSLAAVEFLKVINKKSEEKTPPPSSGGGGHGGPSDPPGGGEKPKPPAHEEPKPPVPATEIPPKDVPPATENSGGSGGGSIDDESIGEDSTPGAGLDGKKQIKSAPKTGLNRDHMMGHTNLAAIVFVVGLLWMLLAKHGSKK